MLNFASITSVFRKISKAQTGGLRGGVRGGLRGGLTVGLPNLNSLIHKTLSENTGGLGKIYKFHGFY